ncbi:MAG: LacI family DNA-binding transcriptional regulator [Anaerolineae bacterium]|jgi:LacI family repressor for deo operon, udp, cdd, tsx, nupC, and nupG
MQSRPTIKDVAARAGVSRQTVSRVINNKGEVSDATRARVLAAIDELGYRPNVAARSIVVGRTCTLGCISPSLTDYTFANIIDSSQAEARRLGYFVLTGSAPTVADVEPLLEEMLRRRVDGLMVLNPRADERYRYFLPLIKKGLAVLYLNSTPQEEPVSSIHCDDRDGGYQATRYLIDLGHKAIATILGPGNEEASDDRLAGYRQALIEAGLACDPDHTIRGDWSATSGYEATGQLLTASRPFSAIFAQNDQMAVGAIRALREAGRQVPDDVSVIGFDDIPLASYFDPPLTTVRQPMQETGERAARLLVETIQNPDRTPEQIAIPARLVERASCGPRRS